YRLLIRSSPFVLFGPLPPPMPTLFPYTTLFRSVGPGAGRGQAGHRRAGHRAADGPHRAHARGAVSHVPALGGRDRGPRGGVPPADRKSTRLNSSHVAISYAVFCLKKKTQEARQV